MNVFSVADDEKLISLIRRAQRRIIFLAPSVTMDVAKALVSCMERVDPSAVTITLDVDAEVCRLGYGEHEATKLLCEKMKKYGAALKVHAGIRLGVLVADDAMMVFAPIPLLVEAGPRDPNAPNAIVIEPPDSVVDNLGGGKNGEEDQTVGLDIASDESIETVGDDLKQNPPPKFDIARTVRIFNAYFQYVEFELKGTFICRRTVPIPNKLMMISNDKKTQELLHASFKLVEETSDLSGKHLKNDKDLIVKIFLKSLTKKYGNGILRKDKADFEKNVENLRMAVTKFGEEVKKKLPAEIDQNREKLGKALLPNLLVNPPKDWKMSDGSKPDNQGLKRLLDDELRNAFGEAEEIIGKMEIKLVFKDVTYESLMDQEFIEIAKKAFPNLEDLLKEEIAVKEKT